MTAMNPTEIEKLAERVLRVSDRVLISNILLLIAAGDSTGAFVALVQHQGHWLDQSQAKAVIDLWTEAHRNHEAMKARPIIKSGEIFYGGMFEDMKARPAKIDGSTSDGHHTFDELYEHRHVLFMKLCEVCYRERMPVWRSRYHSDGSGFCGWFILGIGTARGAQITYHLPDRLWVQVESFTHERERAPEWDGHTAADVLERIRKLTIDFDR